MEDNIADALKMAGSILLFVMGLSISILAFSQARESIDIVLSYSDRESLTIENDARFYYLANQQDTNRYVGKETIIPAIYRAYKENYKIIFQFPDDYYLFNETVEGERKNITTIDLSKEAIDSDLGSRQFLQGIIYHDFTSFSHNVVQYIQKFHITPNNQQCLFEYLTEKEQKYKIKESLGTYYQEDVGGTPEAVEEINKIEKRVITYTFIQK